MESHPGPEEDGRTGRVLKARLLPAAERSPDEPLSGTAPREAPTAPRCLHVRVLQDCATENPKWPKGAGLQCLSRARGLALGLLPGLGCEDPEGSRQSAL